MSEDPVRLDAKTLRGIAHPLRVRLLDLLREDGPSTATRLAQRTGQSSGATSYHLRQLAAYGFVVEDDRPSAGRERWWRAAHRGSTLKADDARQAPAEAEAYLRAVALRYADRMDRWLDGLHGIPREWDAAMTLSHHQFRLRSAEAARLRAELEEVFARYRRDLPDDAAPDDAAPDDAARVVVQYQVMPFLPASAGRAR